MENRTQKFTVLKPVLLDGKIQPKGATVELPITASTKALYGTKHIEEAPSESPIRQQQQQQPPPAAQEPPAPPAPTKHAVNEQKKT